MGDTGWTVTDAMEAFVDHAASVGIRRSEAWAALARTAASEAAAAYEDEQEAMAGER